MFKKLGETIDKGVKALLVVNVFAMLLFSVLSIVLRWFETSFLWIEPLVRHLVFITAFLGAVLATATGRHIAIEILAKYLETAKKEKFHFVLNKFISLLTLGALVWLTYSGYAFFIVEKEYGKLTGLGLHSSTLVAIIPVGFALIFLRTLCDFMDFSKQGSES
jgi:TRAP-type C4-dicarboxylate transport system permease small subunit